MSAPAFVKNCSNLFGPVSQSVRDRLAGVLAAPTEETWDDAYTIILNGSDFMTLWKAWIEVDSSAPRSKPLDKPWPRVPDQLTIYRAIRHATRTDRAVTNDSHKRGE